MSEWKEYKLKDFAVVNPTERISKGTVAKKIPMEVIQPFTKRISAFSNKEYKGGVKFRNGDTIMARITPSLENGKTSFVDILDEDEIAFGSTEFIVLRERDNVSDKHFLYYLAISPTIRFTAIKSMTGSSGRQRVQIGVVKEHLLEAPPLPEQRAIASVLSSLDDKIELLHRQNQTLEHMAETLFRQWFVPARAGDSDAGGEEADEDWEEGVLGDLVEVKYGKDHKKLLDGQIPVYGSGGFMRAVDRPLYDGESVLIPRKGTLNNVMYVDEAFWTVDTMFYTIMKRKHIAKFVYQFIKQKDLASMNVGSAVPSMTTSILNNMPIEIPRNDLLERFDKIVSEFYSKIKFNQTQIRTLTALRDTLLPKLMSGEVRVEMEKSMQV